MRSRGRPRKYKWYSFKEIERGSTDSIQHLKWVSSNNIALQRIAAVGCPNCRSKSFELRHDEKYKLVRFHCLECRYETSYRINAPKPNGFQIRPLYKNGLQVGEEIVDHYHPLTERQRADASVFRTTRMVERGNAFLGGEWHIDIIGGISNQKRYYLDFEEVRLICNWNRLQIEHEKRLHQLESEARL